MLFVTFGLLFGLSILLWCAVLSAMQILRQYREIGYPWESGTRRLEKVGNCVQPTHERQQAA